MSEQAELSNVDRVREVAGRLLREKGYFTAQEVVKEAGASKSLIFDVWSDLTAAHAEMLRKVEEDFSAANSYEEKAVVLTLAFPADVHRGVFPTRIGGRSRGNYREVTTTCDSLWVQLTQELIDLECCTTRGNLHAGASVLTAEMTVAALRTLAGSHIREDLRDRKLAVAVAEVFHLFFKEDA